VLFLDWDDTLLCTTSFEELQVTLDTALPDLGQPVTKDASDTERLMYGLCENLRRLEQCVVRLLTHCLYHARAQHTIILTNAGTCE